MFDPVTGLSRPQFETLMAVAKLTRGGQATSMMKVAKERGVWGRAVEEACRRMTGLLAWGPPRSGDTLHLTGAGEMLVARVRRSS